jgi:hypothetical protein
VTNQQLLNRSQALQRAAEAVQTTRMRYAIQKNLRDVQALLEPYQDTLRQLAEVTYGTLSNGEFEKDPLAGTHKLVVPDMQKFAEADSSIDTLPTTKGDLLQASAKGLALWADQNNLWPGL